MAWRIDKNILRGEIDNRRRGRVRGRIWLAQRDEPLALNLRGNCGRDLAGCVVRFENPSPQPGKISELRTEQSGVAGDVTASRKARVFDVPLEEAMDEGKTPPEHIANCLYVEWFSEANGRVVIESTDYVIEVSPPAWQLTDEEGRAQAEESNAAMLDFMERVGSSAPVGTFDNENELEDAPDDEFQWEKFLRKSDARTEKYGRLLEKYGDHPDSERLIAREMGWTWIEDALDAKARGALPADEPINVEPMEPEPHTEGVDWVRDEDGACASPALQAHTRYFGRSVETL